MNRKLLLMSIGLIFLLTIAIIAASGERRGEAIKVEIIPGSMQLDTDRAACQMYKFDPNTTSITYLTGYGNGDGIVTYFDPTDAAANGCGVAAVYPFEISSLTFMLWNQDGAVWPVGIDVVVYDLATPGDPCGGPGALLCSETVSCDLATFGGTFGTVTFSSPCCVSGPFYIGIHYNDAGSSTTFPGFVSDASDIAPAPVLCDLWDMYLGGSWTEWYSAGWGDPPPNYLLYAVDGETESAVCDDDPWAHHKMHWPQLPDEDGWDVHVDMPMFLADDWTCSETGPITDIHWWGSWLDEQEGVINEFIINIWADVPADPLDPMSYSHPGVHLHSINAPAGSFAITPLMPEEPTMFEDWYDPSAPLVIVDDHQEYFRYDLILDEIDFFDQVEGTVYWLSIECLVEDDGLGKQWGWKNTQDHHLDDAVYYDGQDGWVEIYEYADTLKNWFEIQIDPTGAFVNGVGIGAYMDPTEPPIYPNNPWFNYLEEDWWNVWFYDHPLDPERLKDIWIEYTVMPFEQAIPELFAEITPNWATDLWTLDGMPPGEPRPPLPGDFDYTTTPPTPPEAEWIGRGAPNVHAGPEPDGRYFLRIPDYNPEWVSVDVRGNNVWVEGWIYHLCRASLDLAFVVTSDYAPEPEGACCYPEPTGSGDILCIVTTLTNCEQNLGGSYQGDGTVCNGSIEACCLPDGSCIMADVYCCVNELGGTPQGAGSSCSAPEGCCFPDGSCQDLDPLCCTDMGGTPQGAGTTCTAVEACCMTDGTCQMLDPLCCVDLGGSPQGAQTNCTAVEACCFDDGSCQDLDPLCCVDLGGTPEGIGTTCATTTCEVAPYEQKIWKQAPDLSTEGMDVNATHPMYVLADDFQCTKTEGIQEIHIWGSWFEDVYPGADPPSIEGDPGNVSFHLSIHEDVPAGVLQDWSMPGPMVADWVFEPYEFIYKEVSLEGEYEGWFNPPVEWIPIGDTHCFEYIFKFNDQNWFEQQGSDGTPIVYWLDVQAIIPPGVTPALFGWKTSIEHWNDDAVWFDGEDVPTQLPWFEMRYPMGHPFETASVDQAFMIGGPCDCQPGEADGITTEINILDIVHLINYKYKGGADPIPYALCSGDANCNCTVDILDIVYVINYKYKGGAYPCTCADFILACPGGLR